MPLYDCGAPECTECQRAFGPDRSKAIARFEARERAYAEPVADILNDALRAQAVVSSALYGVRLSPFSVKRKGGAA